MFATMKQALAFVFVYFVIVLGFVLWARYHLT